MDFSIVTPSYNMLNYLKLCCASVADQVGASFEHIVVDGISTDGTVEWLRQFHKGVSIVEKDNGMYDAINKGWKKARGEIVSYLNCDEQYLPGVLEYVKTYFDQYPEVDILFGDFLLVRPDGVLLAHRKGHQPRWFYIMASYLYVFSCTMFVRRRIITNGFWFDDRLKTVGDADLVVRILRHGYRVAHINRYLATFTMTGKNMYASEKGLLERKQWMNTAPAWVRAFKWPLIVARQFERLVSGGFWQKMPLEYAIYDSTNAQIRKVFQVDKASFRWRTE